MPPRTRSLLDNHAMRNRSEPALSHSHPSAVRTACARHQRMSTHPQATEHAYAPRSVYCLHYLHLALHHSSCILQSAPHDAVSALTLTSAACVLRTHSCAEPMLDFTDVHRVAIYRKWNGACQPSLSIHYTYLDNIQCIHACLE